MENKSPNIGVTYGLICGLASVVFGLMLYLGGVEWFMNPIAFLGYVIPIIVAVLGGLRQKKLNGGVLVFGDALKVVFTIFVIGTLISTAFNWVLFNYIDVPFREALSQEAAEKVRQLMEKFGAKQEDIDKAMADSMNKNNYTLGSMALGVAFSCIMWFVVSLIISAIIKKNPSQFPNQFPAQDQPLK